MTVDTWLILVVLLAEPVLLLLGAVTGSYFTYRLMHGLPPVSWPGKTKVDTTGEGPGEDPVIQMPKVGA